MALLETGQRTVTLIGGRDGARLQVACSPEASNYHLGVDPGLWGFAPQSITSSRRGSVPGEVVESVRAEPSLIPFPLTVTGFNPADLDQKLRYLSTVLAPEHPVRVRVASLGIEREITAHYYTGMEAIALRDHRSVAVKLPVILKAFQPFWRNTLADDPEVTGVFNNAQSGGSNSEDIICASDVAETWPEIEVFGPIENAHFMSLERGELLRVLAVLGVNDVVRIVTDPTRRGVWLNGARSRVSIDNRSSFWSLKPNLNRIVMRGSDLSGGGNPGSYRITWSPRFGSC